MSEPGAIVDTFLEISALKTVAFCHDISPASFIY